MPSILLLLLVIVGLWLLLLSFVAYLGQYLPWSTAFWVTTTAAAWGPAVLLTHLLPNMGLLYPLWLAIAVIAALYWKAAVAANKEQQHSQTDTDDLDPFSPTFRL